MKIARQDLALPLRSAPPVRPSLLSRWPLLVKIAVVAILIITVLALQTVDRSPPRTSGASPHFRIASLWQQSRLPTLYLDIKFENAQRLQTERASAQAAGIYIARPGAAVTATVRVGNANVPAQISLPSGQYAPGEWAFEITIQEPHTLLGWRHVLLYDAHARRALGQWGLSESLKREGIPASLVQSVQVAFNGDALGVYGAWPAPEEMMTQNRLTGGLVYFDRTLYYQDLLRQRGNGAAPLSVNLNDCQVATVAALGQADQAAMSRLRDLQIGHRAPSDVLDVEQMGTLLALTTLWQGSPLDDWTRLMFSLDLSTGRLRPVAAPNLIGPPGDNVLRWPVCFDDPSLQAAYVRAVERISRSEYLDKLRADVGSAFDQAQLAFAAQGKPELTWDELVARQKRMARWLEPTEMAQATWVMPAPATLKSSSVLSVSLANLQRVPVEVLGFDVGKSTFLPIDPAWIQDGSDSVISKSKGSVILRAAGDGRLRTLRLSVPYTAVFAAGRAYDEQVEMRVATRLWGLARQQSAPMRQSSGE